MCYNKTMIKIFDGNTGNFAAEKAILTIKEHGLTQGKHVVIVPDRFAMSVEKEIFDLLDIPGSFNIDVVSFTRLAVKKLKNNAKKCLTKEGAIVLTTNILLRKKDELQFFSLDGNRRSLAKDIYAVIASLRTSRISADTLKKEFNGEGDSLSRKYHDLALIYEEYEKSLDEINNAGDTLTRLATYEKLIPFDKELENTHFYIIGFNSFKGSELSIILELGKYAKSVTIALNGGSGGPNNNLFSKKTIEKFKGLATVERVEKSLPEPIDCIYKTIFSYSKRENQTLNQNDRIQVFKEIAPHSEIRGIALEIKSLIKKGYRYKDIALVTHDDSYKDVIDGVFSRLEVPVFIDRKYPLKETLLSRLIENYIQLNTSGFERKRFYDFATNRLLGFQYSDIESLNDWLMSSNINHSEIIKKDFGKSEPSKNVLKTLDSVLKYIELLPDKFTVSEGIENLRNLTSKIDFSILEKIFSDDGFNDEKLYEINSRAQELLDNEFEEFLRLDDKRQITPKEFLDMVKGAIDSVEISLIPNVADAVFVGTNEESRFFDKKIIFIAGASEGKMPRTSSYHAILPEKDINLFHSKNLEIYPTPLEIIREDKGSLAELLTMATDRIYISYSEYSLLGVPETAGEFFKQIASILGVTEYSKLSDKFVVDGKNLADGLGSKKNAKYELLKSKNAILSDEQKSYFSALKDYLESVGENMETTERPSVNTLGCSFYKDDTIVSKVTGIESFYTCPYKYFLDNVVMVKNKDEGKADRLQVGIIIHNVLEKFFSDFSYSYLNMTKTEIEAKTNQILDEIFDNPEFRYLENKSGEIVKNNLRRESVFNILRLVTAVKHSKYRPKHIEYPFEETIGKEITLKGKIDRVDEYDGKFMILDYKTGSVRDKDATKGLYYGFSLQPYLYAIPFLKEGKTPTGAFYVPINETYSKEEESFRYTGKYTPDEIVLKEIDNRLYDVDGILPESLSFDKERHPVALKNAGFSSTDFKFASDYAQELVKKAVNCFREGYIERKPKDDACEYCQYAGTCTEIKVRKISARNLTDGKF